MAGNIAVQHRRGTKAQNDAFTGQDGEVTWDKTLKMPRWHDGARMGGYKGDYGINVMRHGAKADWTGASADATDDTAAIQAAIDLAVLTGTRLVVPAGTYKIVPATAGTSEAGALLYAFTFASKLHVVADKGAVFKIADGVSSIAAPQRMAMFWTNGVVQDIIIDGLTMDMNGAQNSINPLAGPWDNSFGQSQIEVSGTPGGIAARGSNILIQNCSFLNGAGTTCLSMAQSNSAGVSIGSGWRVLNCRFINNGLNASDVSNIYGWANDVVVDRCEFRNDAAPGNTGLKTAYEVHGYDHRFTRNRVINAYRGIYLASNLTAQCNRIIISENVFEVYAYGVEFYRETAAEFAIADVLIANNQFAILDTVVSGIQKAAVTIPTIYGVSDVFITGNNASKSGVVDSAFVSIECRDSASSEKKTKITVANNTAYGFVQGVAIFSRRAVGLGAISVKGNQFVTTGPGVSTTQTAGAIDSLEISGNRFSNGTYGISLGAGTITLLHVQGNSYSNIGTADYSEAATVTTRTGDYDNVAYTPTLTGITIGNGTISGRYTRRGKQITLKIVVGIGSTTSFSGASLAFSLPGTAAAISGINYVGAWIIYDTSASTFYCGSALLQGTATDINLVLNNTAGFVNNATPIAPANGDTISIEITYNET